MLRESEFMPPIYNTRKCTFETQGENSRNDISFEIQIRIDIF